MKKKLLRPNQIITLRDYPVYNKDVLKIYFRIFQKGHGRILPPCPVIHKSIGIPYVKNNNAKSRKYHRLLEGYLEKNPKAEYFLMDGGHKTAAATLAHKKIHAFIVEYDKDLIEARKLKEKGEMFGWHTVQRSVKEIVKELLKHHFGTKEFLTVEDKVKRMVKNKDVPQYMAKYYQKA